MMTIWFMFDNHTFCQIADRDFDGLTEVVARLFKEDGCGSLFVKDGEATIRSLNLHGRVLRKTGKHTNEWGVDFKDIEDWARRVLEHLSFATQVA